MSHRSERVVAGNGAIVEMATLVHEGREHTAMGSVVDEANGLIIGYVSRDNTALTTWAGGRICGLRVVSRFRIPCLGWRRGTEITAYRARFNGADWHGRGAGTGMVLRLRRPRRT